MRSIYWKKLLISSIAYSLLIGGSSLFPNKLIRSAEANAAEIQQNDRTQANYGKKFPMLEEAASILGTDRQTLEKELQGGKSLVDVAKEKGISETDLTAKMLQLRRSKIDEAVKSGRLDAAKAETFKQHMAEHLKFMLNQKGLPNRHEHLHKKSHNGLKPDFSKLAQTLGMSKDQLKKELKSGKSLAEIGISKGISKDQLIETIKTQLTPSIEKLITHKKQTAIK